MSETPDLYTRAFAWYVTSKPVALVWAALFGLMGAGLLQVVATGVTGGERWAGVALAVLFLGLSWASALRGLGDRPARRISAGELDGEPATVIRMSVTSPVAIIVLSGSLGALLLGFGVADGVEAGSWLPIALGLPFVLFACEGMRALTRRARLVITADVLEYRGWDYTARLPWDSVLAVSTTGEKSWAFVRVTGTSADGYRYRPLRRLVPLEHRPEAPNIEISAQALRSADAFGWLLNDLAHASREERVTSIRHVTIDDEPQHRADG